MKKTIVIAEDSELLRWLLAFSLGIDGYEVKAFPNGLEAASYMQENQFDLLITDLNMPVMDGCELINIVRASISKTIPILVFSGTCEKEYELKILKMGVNAYVTKPVSVGELSVLVKHLVYN